RSNTDWHRLLELCSLTETLLIDGDGCYDPADFNDQLLLGLKGTMSSAELHFIRARLQGGKINKARKGELRSPLPVGYVYDEEGNTVVDPDVEVSGAIRILFDTFKEIGSAYGVVRYFAQNELKFPKRAYGGAWDGKLIWGNLVHGRIRDVLRNPAYAGIYVYGRYGCEKTITEEGKIKTKIHEKPMDEWDVLIKDHHEAYVSWDDFVEHRAMLARNQTNRKEQRLPGPAREGLALLQGLLLCADCGRKISVRYKGNGGIYPTYQCTWRKRDGLSQRHCIDVSCAPLDQAISERVVQVLHPSELKVAICAFEELERRSTAVDRQWQLKIERAEYEAQLAQRRYEEVDPSNRLVASTLERRWNEALVNLEDTRRQFDEHRQQEGLSEIKTRKAEILALGKDLPRLWRSQTTKPKDRKRILRLLLKDITIEKPGGEKKVRMQIRWQGGATEELMVSIPPSTADKWRHSSEIIDRVRELAKTLTDRQIATLFTEEGLQSNKGNQFTASGISWIRYKHAIPAPNLKRSEELTVKEVASKFGVSSHVVYYWISRKLLPARKVNSGSPWWIILDDETEMVLRRWSETSPRIAKVRGSQIRVAGGAV
ncbi:recombinase family protein, partial [Myxococcota bacterium]